VAVWRPGMAWPTNTPGGALSPRWGGYTKLFVRCAIGAGNTFHMGPHAFARLDAGNVLGGGVVSSAGDLWVDIACDIRDLEVINGATSSQGILSKPDAGTVTATIWDPEGIYDPLNPGGPFSFGGHTRLVPGTPVEVFAEVVDGDTGTVTTHYLFTGTADSWQQDWTTKPHNRETKLIASDATKNLARMDRPESPSAGAGDTVTQRVHRIVDFFGWAGVVLDPVAGGTVTLQATTLAQSAWELLNRTLDDELGYVYLTAKGELRWLPRSTWSTTVPPSVTLGCGVGYDILVDATPSAIDRQMRNAVYAARAGGVTQSAISQSSIDTYGRYDYTRTDLGLADDGQAATWATTVVTLYGYPQVTLDDVTMRPDVDPSPWKPWRAILGLTPVTDVVRVNWSPPDIPTGHVVDVKARVFGTTHHITRAVWEVKWQLVNTRPAASAGAVFTMGPHPQDRLDSNFVLTAA
jgi:hypothetical protein